MVAPRMNDHPLFYFLVGLATCRGAVVPPSLLAPAMVLDNGHEVLPEGCPQWISRLKR